MKPSEQITEMFKKSCKEAGIDISTAASVPYMVLAVINYLDKVAEKEDERIEEFKRNTKSI